MLKHSRIFTIVIFSILLSLSPILSQNAFAAAPTISTYVADDPDNGDAVYSNGDTLTINLSAASNATTTTCGGSTFPCTVSTGAVTGNFTFGSGDPTAGGASFTAQWTSNSALRLTFSTIGTAVSIGSSTVSVAGGNTLGVFNNGTDNTRMISPGTAATLSGDFGIVASSSDSDGGGDGCKGDCEEPTIGVDSNGKRQVTNGFSYNGHAVDVERFFTPYPLITANVGKTNLAEFKIFENQGVHNIRHFTFAFGMDKGDIISNSKAKIELDIDFDGTETVTVTDPENALDNIKVSTSKVSCMENSTSECLKVSIQHRFRAPLDFNIVGTDVWDTKRSSWQNYYNHGIEVVGDSLNPPKEYDGINKGHIYHLTETGKNTAIDEFGDSWTFQYGTWNKDFIKHERISDGETMVFDRMHSDFTEYKKHLSSEAFSQLMELCPLCVEQYADFKGYETRDYGSTINKLSNPEIQMIMSLEETKAQNILKYIMDPKLSSTEKYKTPLEFEKDDRPISEILEEERIMKLILQAERDWLKQVIGPNQ